MSEIACVEQRTRYDCLRCCLAAILGVDYDSLPAELEDEDRQWPTVSAIAADHGMVATRFGLHGQNEPMLLYGARPIQYHVGFMLRGALWIASVRSPRIENGAHAVVMRGSKIEWDPHPQRAEGHCGFVEAHLFLPASPVGSVQHDVSQGAAMSDLGQRELDCDTRCLHWPSTCAAVQARTPTSFRFCDYCLYGPVDEPTRQIGPSITPEEMERRITATERERGEKLRGAIIQAREARERAA